MDVSQGTLAMITGRKHWFLLVLLLASPIASVARSETLECDAGHCDGQDLMCDGAFCAPWEKAPVSRFPCSKNSFWVRPTLTGDWCGLRTRMRESGVTFRGTVTQFGFGVEGGINSPAVPPALGQGDTFKYTGRGEYDFGIDLGKVLHLRGAKLLIGAQHWWGQFGSVSFNTGALVPALLPAVAPPVQNRPGEVFLTDFLVTMPITKRLVVFAGKKNVLGSADQDIFAGGDGTDQFMNQALVANPAYLLALPYSSFTAGLVMPRDWGMATLYVWDPQERTKQGLKLDRLFSQGVILGTQVKVNTNFFSKPGEHHVGGIWKHLDQIDLSLNPPPGIGFPGQAGAGGLPTKRDAYTIYYGFDQYVQVFPGERRSPLPIKPPRGWGLFGRASISDGNPTPYDYFLSLGVGGDTRFGNDRGDAFGIGWYYNGVSDSFSPAVSTLLGRREGTGLEVYYKFQLTPWMAVTPDLQYIRPGFGSFTSGDDAFVYGLRLNMIL